MNIKTPYTVGFVRDLPRRPASAQKARMTANGIKKVYTDCDLLVRQRIAGIGDVVAVDILPVLADPKDSRKLGGLSASLMRTVAALDHKGVEIWQLDGDLRSTKQADRARMINEAFGWLHRKRHSSSKIGRRPFLLTDQQRQIAEPLWFNRLKYETNEIAAKAITVAFKKAGCPRNVTAAILAKHHHLGPSGRLRVKSKQTKR